MIDQNTKTAEEVLREVRDILKTPEGKMITEHAKNLMKKLDEYAVSSLSHKLIIEEMEYNLW